MKITRRRHSSFIFLNLEEGKILEEQDDIHTALKLSSVSK